MRSPLLQRHIAEHPSCNRSSPRILQKRTPGQKSHKPDPGSEPIFNKLLELIQKRRLIRGLVPLMDAFLVSPIFMQSHSD
jgi:hypothetical protein